MTDKESLSKEPIYFFGDRHLTDAMGNVILKATKKGKLKGRKHDKEIIADVMSWFDRSGLSTRDLKKNSFNQHIFQFTNPLATGYCFRPDKKGK